MPIERVEQILAAVLITAGVAFAIGATFVYIPTFILLNRSLRRPLTRTRAVLIGGALGLVPRILIAWRFEESGLGTALVIDCVRRLPHFALSVLPFAIAGAVFGLLWYGKRGTTS